LGNNTQIKYTKKILDQYQIKNYSNNDENNNIKKENNDKNSETPNSKKCSEEDALYKQYIFDEDYLIKNYESKKENNYNTNYYLIEKLCINLENKIILAKLEIIYIELICKNINSLCLINDPIKNKVIDILKGTSIRLIKLLINFLCIPESGFLEPELTFEDVVCLYLKQMASNINDESLYNQQLGNLPKIMEIIAYYETNENEIKGNLVKSMIITVI
jgi:hypothetical protein